LLSKNKWNIISDTMHYCTHPTIERSIND